MYCCCLCSANEIVESRWGHLNHIHNPSIIAMASTSCLNSFLVVAVDALLCFRGSYNITVSVVANLVVVQMYLCELPG